MGGLLGGYLGHGCLTVATFCQWRLTEEGMPVTVNDMWTTAEVCTTQAMGQWLKLACDFYDNLRLQHTILHCTTTSCNKQLQKKYQGNGDHMYVSVSSIKVGIIHVAQLPPLGGRGGI